MQTSVEVSQVARSAVDQQASQVARSAVDQQASQVARSAVDQQVLKQQSVSNKQPRNILSNRLQQALAQREHTSQLRSLLTCGDNNTATAANTIEINGQSLISFASNDYLGLRQHADVRKGFADAAQRYGLGAGASHLLGGHHPEHAALEAELAGWVGAESVVLFGSGFQAAIGALGALLNEHDAVAIDRLAHACLLDGAQASGARCQRFAHNDATDAGRILAHHSERAPNPDALRWIISESVFSMDGDSAPVPELIAMAKHQRAALFLDEAHALGVLGEHGAGLGAAHADFIDVRMLTFGKALGSMGAAIAGSRDLIRYLHNFARSFVYTTALPPAIAAATRISIKLAQQSEWRERLHANIRYFRSNAASAGLHLLESHTPIQALPLPAEHALQIADAVRAAGFYAPLVRPPTVPKNGERLRISINALHTHAQINQLLDCLATAAKSAS
jgi:8-amino-7-oxononanoate synthase